ncbi:S-adenosylmethionine:tRNA ribosyltransferase-isomerase [Calidithermus terrae]|uniref:S-adenosylmethionine:tRNA ribosyltransferase-isomerase n=1 Tax=Calidithermus terrae TaxID=1408545 RepID=A0A399EIC6_9DEIN|nr:S-adenosylmethionine:tRNA ribosyltransferase-isomerase [Calidithermus terrae]RIH83020.1 S-adenosylmethionine:tRNA ribosyltransferase-isomerase [Calidithermus terrae]
MTLKGPSLEFALPEELEAHEPPEARGLSRDGVRLMVSYRQGDRLAHARFRDLPEFLREGDVLVVNTSGTLPAALPAFREDGSELRLHLSTRLPGGVWTVELRRLEDGATKPYGGGQAGETLRLPGGASVTLLARHRMEGAGKAGSRLWVASFSFPEPYAPDPLPYLLEHGKPIRYGYVGQEWPLEFYQTVYATEMGSAEMPSAGRAFTPEVLTRLLSQGVLVVPLLLHTGVASLESHEPPYEEFYRVPPVTAQAVSQAKAEGRRVVAVGTTVVRALETVADPLGRVHPGEGWTRLLVTPERGVRAVDGILTGWHEPKATHLMMLEAIAGRGHLEAAYQAALEQRYLWHEFGDLHLILP